MTGRTFLVGDVHGCARELMRLLELISYDPSQDRMLLLGDAFDRGPESALVLKLIHTLGLELLRGNHEEAFLRWLQFTRGRSVECPLLGERRKQVVMALDEAAGALGIDLLDFLESLPMSLRTPRYLAVHAGIDPALGLSGTPPRQLNHLRRLAHLPGRPFWFDCYEGPELIVFGHIASRAVIERFDPGGRRIALGLDTGCVYGHALTAWEVEADRLVRVEAVA